MILSSADPSAFAWGFDGVFRFRTFSYHWWYTEGFIYLPVAIAMAQPGGGGVNGSNSLVAIAIGSSMAPFGRRCPETLSFQPVSIL
jgi:hypothetical protein